MGNWWRRFWLEVLYGIGEQNYLRRRLMRTLRWSFVLAVLIATCATEANAVPIEPQTLLMLTSKSELIVAVKVESVSRIKSADGFSSTIAIARLNIISVVICAIWTGMSTSLFCLLKSRKGG